VATDSLKMEADLPYQRAAIDAICDLFGGQQSGIDTFTVLAPGSGDQGRLGDLDVDTGHANPRLLPDEALLANLRRVQVRNGLAPAQEVESHRFTVEMETGTGKTYVYLRTIYELHQKYGFSKFIVVVPSVAIREGTLASLEGMREHLEELYDGTPINAFIYDSNDMGQIRNFATSSGLQLMIMTVAAISGKDVVRFEKPMEDLGDQTPAEVVTAVRPVVIVDEPQSVTSGSKGKEAVDALEASFTVGYSATHKEPHHMVYRLSPADAYRQELVKQIEVASVVEEMGFNEPFLRVLDVRKDKGKASFSARVEVHRHTDKGTKEVEVVVRPGDDLAEVTGRPDVYGDHFVGHMTKGSGNKPGSVVLKTPKGEVELAEGGEHGGVDRELLVRVMIRETIREHLDKEARLRPLGIKVLSLFFIDKVENYRGLLDEQGNYVQGLFEKIFEEEFARAANAPAFRGLFDTTAGLDVLAREVHGGYFSQDKHGAAVDTNEGNKGGREAAQEAYELIMRDKVRLLKLHTPLRFIFSHSALREGWDNPNVFQICSLREIRTERERRQTLGRGLRICFNQENERVKGFKVNRLTVIANEQYENYARRLQKEMEDEEGQRFGVVEEHRFARLFLDGREDEASIEESLERSSRLFSHLQEKGYLDSKGLVTDELRRDLDDEDVALPEEFWPEREAIVEDLIGLCGRLEVEDARERVEVSVREQVSKGDPFEELWERIRQKTVYSLDFDDDDLTKACVEELDGIGIVPEPQIVVRHGEIIVTDGGIDHEEGVQGSPIATGEDLELHDLLRIIERRTRLTRSLLLRVLNDADRIRDFRRNPQGLIDLAAQAIIRAKRLTFARAVSYRSLGKDDRFGLDIFAEDQGTAYRDKVRMGAGKSLIEPVVYDSLVERDFCDALEHHRDVLVYAKLPNAFRINTPGGTYNPDWAVVFQNDEGKRLYKVIETKGTTDLNELRREEAAKIHCAKVHFATIEQLPNPAQYEVAHRLSDVTLDYD
jgi:type III restriction enzyme